MASFWKISVTFAQTIRIEEKDETLKLKEFHFPQQEWRVRKLFDRLKCKFKMKTTEKQGVGVHFLAVVTPLWRSVRMTLTFPKWGLGSPPRLLKTQNSISGVKTPCLEMFFIPLERSWSLDVENGLAWAIRTSAAQVMCERRAGSQIASLTPDH
jgi:hypothetical protein